MPRVEAKHVSYYRRWCVFPGVVVLRVVVLGVVVLAVVTLGLVVTGLVHAVEGGREVLFNPEEHTETANKMSDGSDIEMQSTLPKIQTKKIPQSPSEEILKGNQEPKRVSTKVMIHQALTDLKSRKGTSLYAIKKYIDEKYNVDIKKINNIIKKLIKAEVEAGVIIQTKGVGASGSFKLVVGKDKVEKKKEKIKKLAQKVKEPDDKSKKSIKSKTEAKTKENLEKKSKKTLEKKLKKKENVDNKMEIYKKMVKAKGSKEGKESKEGKMKKRNAKKMAKGTQTPAKKRAAMMKRKSIGSIIKPPKMRPKAKA